MLDGAFMQETSNIIEDTFSAYNICKGRIFDEINKGTAWHSITVQYYGTVLRQSITVPSVRSYSTIVLEFMAL